MSNEKLFNQAYGATHYAAEELAKMYQKIQAGAGLAISDDFLPSIQKVRLNLQEALCAATELESRAKGNKPKHIAG